MYTYVPGSRECVREREIHFFVKESIYLQRKITGIIARKKNDPHNVYNALIIFDT